MFSHLPSYPMAPMAKPLWHTTVLRSACPQKKCRNLHKDLATHPISTQIWNTAVNRKQIWNTAHHPCWAWGELPNVLDKTNRPSCPTGPRVCLARRSPTPPGGLVGCCGTGPLAQPTYRPSYVSDLTGQACHPPLGLLSANYHRLLAPASSFPTHEQGGACHHMGIQTQRIRSWQTW